MLTLFKNHQHLLDQDFGQSNVSLIYRLYIKGRSKNYIFDMASILADS